MGCFSIFLTRCRRRFVDYANSKLGMVERKTRLPDNLERVSGGHKLLVTRLRVEYAVV